ncbi:MAG: transporter substrate-binding domain-containing protein [Bacillota bacterium]
MNKKILVIVLVMMLLVTACTQSETSLMDKDTLRVGMELKYPPFEGKDEEDNPEGVSVELAKGLGEYLGKDVKIVDTPYPSLIPSLMSGEIDIIISSMTITPARAKKVDFSDPYTNSQLMMLVHEDSKVKSHEDLNDSDVTIVSKTGTIGALWAKENAPKANIKNVNEESTAVLEVSQGKGDVFIYDPLSIIRHHKNHPDTTRTILEPLPNTKGWGIAMKKDQPEFKKKVNEYIEKAKNDGTYDRLRKKYLKEKIKEFEKYDIDFFF